MFYLLAALTIIEKSLDPNEFPMVIKNANNPEGDKMFKFKEDKDKVVREIKNNVNN